VTASQYIRWLPNSITKHVSAPNIVRVPAASFRGRYVSPRPSYRGMDAQRGIILLSEGACESTIAHEWRHHWQNDAGWTWSHKKFDRSLSYVDAVVQYFRQPHEFDALVFQHKIAPTAVTSFRLSCVCPPLSLSGRIYSLPL